MANYIHKLFYGSHGEVMRYLAIGALNVLITWALYAVFVLLGMNPALSNALTWIIGVAVAFLLNKIIVFESTSLEKKKVGREAVNFTVGRIFTGVVNIAGFALLYNAGMNQELLGVDGFLAKIVISIVEIVLNYYISKYMVFQKDKGTETE